VTDMPTCESLVADLNRELRRPTIRERRGYVHTEGGTVEEQIISHCDDVFYEDGCANQRPTGVLK